MAEKQASELQCTGVVTEEETTSRILDECKSAEGTLGEKEENRKAREPSSESDARLKRQIKKDDSGISVEKSENSSEEDASKRSKRTNDLDHGDECRTVAEEDIHFPKLKMKSKNRNYRSKTTENDRSSDDEDVTDKVQEEKPAKEGRSSPDSGNLESRSTLDDVDMEEGADTTNDTNEDADNNEARMKTFRVLESDESNDSSDSHVKKTDTADSDWEEVPGVLLKPKPKHKWFVVQEVVNRQRGVTTRRQGPQLFQQRCYGSLHCVQRLELMYKLEAFHGCVNALHFNSSGTLLASGSDDLSIVVWDWPLGKMLVMHDSGHRSNVFQVKFLPLKGDLHLVSCGRDGQIRMAEMSSTGACRSTRLLGSHRGPAHKLSILPENPHVFLSSGEDGVVMSVDVRASKPHKLITVQEDERNIALYSIHCNPLNNNEFCVSGRNNYIRIYDRRKVSSHGELKKFCPNHLTSTGFSSHVTCAVFNYNGTEILGSYNDEDIYLFDVRNPNGTEYVHKYEGHRNSATVKGVNFFGPRSEFIVSGSDCGNIFFWDKNTEAIVQWMAGDENGVVNCLEPHPQMPVIATSGLDDDVKIWVPSCEQEPKMEGLKSTIISNQKARDDERVRDPDAFDGQMLWILWRHLQRNERFLQQHRGRGQDSDFPRRANGQRHSPSFRGQEDSSSSSDSSNTSDADDEERRIQCSPS